jgi:capsular polysaccharide biosynthesis protein
LEFRSQTRIDYKMPVNMLPEHRHLFVPDYEYLKVKLRLKELRNVFVNHYGLCVKNGLLVKGCAPNTGRGNYDDRFYYPHWRKAFEQMLVCRWGKSLKSIRLDDGRTYLLIHSPWFSYYFWVTECIPRLLMAKAHLGEVVLLYPENWEKLSFVNQTLEIFPKLDKQKIPSDVHLFVGKLLLPEVKPWSPMFIPEQVHETRDFLFGHLDSKRLLPRESINVYISRKDAKYKRFVDEESVENMFAQKGFEIVQMGKLSFFDQINFMRGTDHLAAITGAGLANILFMKAGGSFLDMTNSAYIQKDKYKFHFWKLCNILAVNYYVEFFRHENLPGISFSRQNLQADTDRLSDIVDLMMN